MTNFKSSQLVNLKGIVGYIEIDNDLRLIENTTFSSDQKAADLAGVFISFFNTYQASHRDVRTISIACGTSVYVGVGLPSGYLVVQMNRDQKLIGVRRAITEIVDFSLREAEAQQAQYFSENVHDTSVPAAIKIAPLEELHTPKSEVSTTSVWPEFKVDFLKILSPFAPENIIHRLLGNAFKKHGLDIIDLLNHSQIQLVAHSTLEGIPNAARRKSAESDLVRLFSKYHIDS